MVKKQKVETSASITLEQQQEFTRIAKQLIQDMGERLPSDSWDPVSSIEETPIVDVIPGGHVIVRSEAALSLTDHQK